MHAHCAYARAGVIWALMWPCALLCTLYPVPCTLYPVPGVIWGLMWPCTLLHAQRLVPDCLKTTMVGLVTSIYWGVGASAGVKCEG